MPPQPTLAPPPERRSARIASIDSLRGCVMILMVLDHTRGFFTNRAFNPVDLTQTFPALFFTRWITYFCAPVFFLLAGSSAYLSGLRRTRAELSRFLVTRGLWLAFLDMTFLNWFAWSDTFSMHHYLAVVFWALGWSMVVLAGLVWLPIWAIGVIGGAVCIGHNLLDSVTPESFGSLAWLWRFLYAGGRIEMPGNVQLDIMYRLIPWAGVMALGYACGPLFQIDSARRRGAAFRTGLALIALFIAIRFLNQYGDPSPWSPQKNRLFTVMSFLNCTKYPPSLDFLLMTLGPALLLLSLVEREPEPFLKPVQLFGHVPLFFFLLHLPLARVAATIAKSFHAPAYSGYGLVGVYVAWITIVLLLYAPCRAFAALKQRNKSRWLSYL